MSTAHNAVDLARIVGDDNGVAITEQINCRVVSRITDTVLNLVDENGDRYERVQRGQGPGQWKPLETTEWSDRMLVKIGAATTMDHIRTILRHVVRQMGMQDGDDGDSVGGGGA